MTNDAAPPPGRGRPAGEVLRRGTGRCAGPNLVRAFLADPPRSGIDPLAGAPPTGGWWWEYQTFSTQFTMGLPPCMRNHSAARAPGEEPRPGLVSAFPSDTQTGVSASTTAQTADRTGWRPTTVRRARRISRRRARLRDQRAQRASPRWRPAWPGAGGWGRRRS